MVMTEPVAGMVRRDEQRRLLQRDWTSYLREIGKLDVLETQGALRMGDLFLEMERQFGGQHLKRAAWEAGITWKSASERMRVSRAFPPDSPARKRKCLTYSHYRTLAPVETRELWAQRVEEEQLRVYQLVALLDQRADHQAAERGESCPECGGPLPVGGRIARAAVGAERARVCGPACGIKWFEARLEPPEEPQDPFRDVLLDTPLEEITEDPWAELETRGGR